MGAMKMRDESNRENEMTDLTSDNDLVETQTMPAQNLSADTDDIHDNEVMPAQNGNDDTTETTLAQHSAADADDTEAMPTSNGNDDTTETMPVWESSADATETEAIPANDDTAETMSVQDFDTDAVDSEAAAVQSSADDTTETLPVQDADTVTTGTEDEKLAQNDNAASDSSEAGEGGSEAGSRPGTETAVGTETETGIEMVTETEAGEETKTGTKIWDEDETGTAFSDASSQIGYVPPQAARYVPPSNFASGPAPSGAYVRVPRDMPQQMPKPQPPTGPSKATIIFSLLPLCLGALMLIVGSAFPMVFMPVSGGADVRSLIALFVVVLGALLIGLAVLLGLASLIHKGTVKWKARRRQ